jgi:hypothetical protein
MVMFLVAPYLFLRRFSQKSFRRFQITLMSSARSLSLTIRRALR